MRRMTHGPMGAPWVLARPSTSVRSVAAKRSGGGRVAPLGLGGGGRPVQAVSVSLQYMSPHTGDGAMPKNRDAWPKAGGTMCRDSQPW
jgi:hypothetical protein